MKKDKKKLLKKSKEQTRHPNIVFASQLPAGGGFVIDIKIIKLGVKNEKR